MLGLFAGKEAVSKALFLNWEQEFVWRDIEIIRQNCHYDVALSGPAKRKMRKINGKRILLATTYCPDYIIALAILTGDEKDGVYG